MSTTKPRGPRSPVTRTAPEKTESEGSEQPEVIEAHGAIAVLEEQPAEGYTGRWGKCRKPFVLNGRRYTTGEDVPVDLIPRPESWVHTGYIEAL